MLNVFFIGFRHNHIYSIYRMAAESPDFQICGCFESDDAARAAAERELGASFTDRPLAQVLGDPGIDAVAIGDYYAARGPLVCDALRSGKHVIVDKPMCLSLEELRRIKSLAAERRKAVLMMLDLRYQTCAIRAKQIVSDNILGRIHNISFNGQHYLDYGNRPSWYFQKGMHGGTFNDLAVHGIDLIRFITGLEIAKIDAARTWNGFAAHCRDFPDCAIFMARLSNGGGLLGDVSYSAPYEPFGMPTYWDFKFWGEKAMMALCIAGNKLTLYRDGGAEVIDTEVANPPSLLMDFQLQIEGKSGAVLTGRDCFISTEAALRLQAAAAVEC